MGANLKAKVSLDTSEFSRGISSLMSRASSAASSLKSIGNAAGGALLGVGALGAAAVAALAPGIKSALDFGGAMSELSARTGVGAGDLAVLQQAFHDAGMSADSVGPAINKMQKALTGVNEKGEPTNKTFEALKINLEEIRKQTPAQQFSAIGAAIGALKSPAERATAAMAIFGKSGGEMLSLFADSGAMSSASGIIGSQADILNRSAARFDEVSDKLNSVGVKIRGFFLGMAESLLPALERAANFLASLDLAPIGKKLGDSIMSAVNILVNAFKTGQLSELFGMSIKLGAMIGVDFLVKTLRGAVSALSEMLGQAMAVLLTPSFWSALQEILIATFSGVSAILLDAFNEPIRALEAGLTYVFEKVGSFFGTKLGSVLMPIIRTLNPILGLGIDQLASPGKGRDYEDIYKTTKANFYGANKEDMTGVMEAAVSRAKSALKELMNTGILSGEGIAKAFSSGFDSGGVFDKNIEETKAKLMDLAKSLNIPMAAMQEAVAKVATGGTELSTGTFKRNQAASALENVGAIIPGGKGSPTAGNPALTQAKKTASHAEQINAKLGDLIKRLGTSPQGQSSPLATFS